MDDGSSLGAHLAQLEKAQVRRGKAPAVAPVSYPPWELTYLWDIFDDLHARRSSSGFAPASINYSEILAYSQLHDIRLAPWELNVLCSLDSVWLKVWSDARSSGTDNADQLD